MVIQHNLSAMNSNRQFNINVRKNRKATEKLSSGYKINRAADDAAGLSISEKMRKQIRGLNQAAQNVQEGIGFAQVADGALDEAQAITQRMNELAIKAANGTASADDRSYIDSEIQELKKELDRIFDTTKFNEQKIWDRDSKVSVPVGYVDTQVLKLKAPSTSYDISNANSAVLARDGYMINADDTGVSISWKGYNGTNYETEKADWDTLRENNYTFNMEDFFGTNVDLYDDAGNPLITKKISFAPIDYATYEDMAKALNGTRINSSVGASMSANFEDASGNNISHNGIWTSTSLTYSAAYVSNQTADDTNTATTPFDFDNASDTFIQPADASGNILTASDTSGNLISFPDATKNLSNPPTADEIEAARNSTQGWEFSFYMEGIGKVTGTSAYLSYYSHDDDDVDEGIWWKWNKRTDGSRYKSNISRTTDATLGGLMDTLTGNKDAGTPGILSKGENGWSESGGIIQMRFDLKADPYSSGVVQNATSVGSVYFYINVENTDTEAGILQKISDAFNETTRLDFKTTGNPGSHTMNNKKENTYKIPVPRYGFVPKEHEDFLVHAGPGSGLNEQIKIEYEVLSLDSLGLKDTNVLTQYDARKTIDELDSAIRKLSSQRSQFGAYQNRLEHAYKIDTNTAENTQAAESAIRDTDMAKTMVEYSNNSILLQAGQSMLAQANQSNQAILGLIQ